jgi:hypothetical protein
MAWDAAFIANLSSSYLHPRWLLETVVDDNEFQVDTALFLSSHGDFGFRQVLTPNGTRYSGGLLHPGDWRQTYSQLEVGVRATSAATVKSWLIGARRGSLLQLKLGWPGWARADYEPVFTGILVGARRVDGDQWVLQLRSVLSALQSRFTTTQGEAALFYDGVWTTTVGTDYTAGDATLVVAGAVVGAPTEAGNYLLRVTPNTGDQFLVMATGTSGGFTFTGLGTGQLGTVRRDADAGNLVEALPFIYATPTNAVRKICDSTGVPGRNGPFDDLPKAWGLSLPYEVWDRDDIERTEVAIEPGLSGPYKWHVWADAPVDDALSWLTSWLAPAGILLTEHHGELSMRAVTGPDSHPYGTQVVEDRDIARIDGYDYWDSTVPLEAAVVAIVTPDSGTLYLGSLEGKPAIERVEYVQPFIEEDQGTWRTGIGDRLAQWANRVPETVELTLRGWKYATLGVGDHVRVRSTRIVSRGPDTDPPWMVLSVEPAWFGDTPHVRVRLALPPDTAVY